MRTRARGMSKGGRPIAEVLLELVRIVCRTTSGGNRS